MRLLAALPEEKNDIADCDDVEAIAPFKFGASHKFHSRDFGYFKPKTMPSLMDMLSKLFFGEDLWLPS